MKLWGARFSGEEDALLKTFDNSLPLEKRYYKEDITGSIAHAKMLGQSGIISSDESKLLSKKVAKI